jgi:hypothetical protein
MYILFKLKVHLKKFGNQHLYSIVKLIRSNFCSDFIKRIHQILREINMKIYFDIKFINFSEKPFNRIFGLFITNKNKKLNIRSSNISKSSLFLRLFNLS